MANNKRRPKNKPTQGKRQQREQKRRDRRQRSLIVAMLIVGLILIGAFSFWPRNAGIELPEGRLNDEPARGPDTAPVTIIEYGDFGCPACRAWHQAGVLDLIEETYGEDVRIVWRDLPIITAHSPKAAEAAQCAHDQGKFWEYHDILFGRAPRFSVSELKTYAEDIGLDVSQFNVCLDSGLHEATVDHDMRAAFGAGLRGTPAFVVNGMPLVGTTPQRMVEIIESLLANQ